MGAAAWLMNLGFAAGNVAAATPAISFTRTWDSEVAQAITLGSEVAQSLTLDSEVAQSVTLDIHPDAWEI